MAKLTKRQRGVFITALFGLFFFVCAIPGFFVPLDAFIRANTDDVCTPITALVPQHGSNCTLVEVVDYKKSRYVAVFCGTINTTDPFSCVCERDTVAIDDDNIPNYSTAKCVRSASDVDRIAREISLLHVALMLYGIVSFVMALLLLTGWLLYRDAVAPLGPMTRVQTIRGHVLVALSITITLGVVVNGIIHFATTYQSPKTYDCTALTTAVISQEPRVDDTAMLLLVAFNAARDNNPTTTIGILRGDRAHMQDVKVGDSLTCYGADTTDPNMGSVLNIEELKYRRDTHGAFIFGLFLMTLCTPLLWIANRTFVFNTKGWLSWNNDAVRWSPPPPPISIPVHVISIAAPPSPSSSTSSLSSASHTTSSATSAPPPPPPLPPPPYDTV